MKFQPFGNLVLVEQLDIRDDITSKTGLYMPDTHRQRVWKVKIIKVSKEVNLEIKQGDVCMSNPVPEVDDQKMFDNPNYRLINASHILGRWDKE
jgi:co-chaperonin GroES (HSP10)